MIYGEKFLGYNIVNESKEDKKKEYDELIELSKKNIDLEFKDLDRRIKHFNEVFNILKGINKDNYKAILDKALAKSKAFKSSYNYDESWNKLKDKYGGDIFNFKNFKFMYNTPENDANVNYFKKELSKLKSIDKESYKDCVEKLKFASEKEKELKDVMHYNPFDKAPCDDTEFIYNAIEDVIESAYDSLPGSTIVIMKRDFKSIFRALGRKDIDVYNN